MQTCSVLVLPPALLPAVATHARAQHAFITCEGDGLWAKGCRVSPVLFIKTLNQLHRAREVYHTLREGARAVYGDARRFRRSTRAGDTACDTRAQFHATRGKRWRPSWTTEDYEGSPAPRPRRKDHTTWSDEARRRVRCRVSLACASSRGRHRQVLQRVTTCVRSVTPPGACRRRVHRLRLRAEFAG
jgi:hypothetical protein